MAELYAMEEAKNYNKWIVSLCCNYLSGKALEIGAGIGTFTQEWINYADTLVALEIADNCIDVLNDRFKKYNNVMILKQDICTITKDYYSSFDSAIAINVFEHIDDEQQGLRKVYLSLKEGGVFAIYLPAFQILFGKTDKAVGHYRRYNKKNLNEKLIFAGFNVEEIHYVNWPGFLVWLLCKNKCNLLAKGNIKTYDNTIVPLLSTFERMVKPPFGQSIFAIAYKSTV